MLELDKIYNMDCIEGMKQTPDDYIDLIVTDPPYNIKKDDWDKINNFDLWLENWMQLCHDKLKANGSIWIFCSSWFLPRVCLIFDRYFNRRNIIIWAYANGRITQNGFAERYEPILYGTKNKKEFVFNGDDIRIPRKRKDNRYLNKYSSSGKIPESVWFLNRLVYTPKKHKFGFHPTKKPESVIDRIVKVSSNKNDIVYDLFSGSGTIASVCKKLNRRFIAFEIQEDYYNISLRRLANIPKRLDEYILN